MTGSTQAPPFSSHKVWHQLHWCSHSVPASFAGKISFSLLNSPMNYPWIHLWRVSIPSMYLCVSQCYRAALLVLKYSGRPCIIALLLMCVPCAVIQFRANYVFESYCRLYLLQASISHCALLVYRSAIFPILIRLLFPMRKFLLDIICILQ